LLNVKLGGYRYIIVFTESSDSTDVQFNEFNALIGLLDPGLIVGTLPSVSALPGRSLLKANEAITGKFKQSCILYTYADWSLLYSVLKRSTYIHSWGLLLLASPMEAINVDDVKSSISQHLVSERIQSFELSFYTEELFANRPDVLKGILIDEKRFFLQNLPFRLARETLMNWQGPQRIVPTFDKSNVDARIWIFKDVAPGLTMGSEWTYWEKNDEIYLIVYQPLCQLKNPIYFLDEAHEAKPYWRGIDTTPQRLMGAMLNLVGVKDGEVVLDPFVYTGTLPLEAVRLNLEQIHYSDILETLGAKDNIEVLTDSVSLIENTIQKVKNIMRLGTGDSYETILQVAQDSLVWDLQQPYPIEMHSIDKLMAIHPILQELAPRLFFYMVRRFFVEGFIGLTKSVNGQVGPHFGCQERFSTPAEFRIALEKHVTQALSHLEDFTNVRRDWVPEMKRRGLIEIGYNPIARDKCHPLGQDTMSVDLMKDGIPLHNDSVDAIVTDPPYGYGSLSEENQLHNLYQRFFEEAFRVLRPGGRVAMCVLDKIRTGKYTSGELKTQRVVELANDVAKRKSISFRSPTLNPFQREERLLSFWKAKHKLNRGILTFQIHK
jgi:DNA modification methylase